MSDAEILAMDVLNIRDRHGSMEEIVARIEKALQDQREACGRVYAARYETQQGTRNHRTYQAIRKAEV